MALLLRRQGIRRIRPLEGGLGAWRDHGFPLETARAPGGEKPQTVL